MKSAQSMEEIMEGRVNEMKMKPSQKNVDEAGPGPNQTEEEEEEKDGYGVGASCNYLKNINTCRQAV